MTRFRIGIGLLLVLLVLCFWSQARMTKLEKPVAELVLQAEASAAGEDWPGAAGSLSRAREQWEDHRTFAAALADHQPLEDVESLFAVAETYSVCRDGTRFRATCQELNRRILAVMEAQELNIGSIF